MAEGGPVRSNRNRTFIFALRPEPVIRVSVKRSLSDSGSSGQTCPVPSLNHLVRAQQERLWHREPERFGGLEVDYQLELGWLLDGQISRFGTFENLNHVTGRQPPPLEKVSAIGNKATIDNELPSASDRWQLVLRRESR